MSKNFITYITILIAVGAWGFSFIWTNKIISQDLPLYTFLTFRMSIAATVLFILSISLKKLQKIQKKDIKWILAISLLQPFLYFFCETKGIETSGSPTLSAIIISTIPIFVLIFDKILNGTKVSGKQIFGILITIPGIGILVGFDSLTPKYWWGVGLLLLAVLTSTLYNVLIKKLGNRYNPYTINTYCFFIGTLLFLPFAFSEREEVIISRFLTIDAIIPILSLGIICSSIAFLFYVNGVQKIGPTKTSVFVALSPIFTATGAMLYGQESLDFVQMVGIFIVIIGVILSQRK